MKIAVQGCCHGELDEIYAHIAQLEETNGHKVSLLLICGDFQAIRNVQDLQCMAVPDKYKKLGEFYKYYTGEKKAPLLTLVIGGNHEASNYFWELYHGGWVAPNVYFLGHAGCLQVNGIRIAGASGIFQNYDFRKGHFERVPYDRSSMRSIYHVREYNIRRLSLLSTPDIFLSHDWPQGIEHYGDLRGLLRHKPFFKNDINKGALGSPPMMGLLRTLRPKWWFSAHLHTKYEATVVHDAQHIRDSASARRGVQTDGTNPDEIAIDELDAPTDVTAPETVESTTDSIAVPTNPDEIKLDDEEEDVAPVPPPPSPVETKFLALDKCLPKRRFLEVVDIPEPTNFFPQSSETTPTLTFDPEWLAITRVFNPYMSLTHQQAAYPGESEARAAIQRELQWVREHVYDVIGGGDVSQTKPLVKSVTSCQEFCITAPPPGTNVNGPGTIQPPHYPNPQTAAFCQMLDIENKVDF